MQDRFAVSLALLSEVRKFLGEKNDLVITLTIKKIHRIYGLNIRFIL